jgi:hypothetical protein
MSSRPIGRTQNARYPPLNASPTEGAEGVGSLRHTGEVNVYVRFVAQDNADIQGAGEGLDVHLQNGGRLRVKHQRSLVLRRGREEQWLAIAGKGREEAQLQGLLVFVKSPKVR